MQKLHQLLQILSWIVDIVSVFRSVAYQQKKPTRYLKCSFTDVKAQQQQEKNNKSGKKRAK